MHTKENRQKERKEKQRFGSSAGRLHHVHLSSNISQFNNQFNRFRIVDWKIDKGCAVTFGSTETIFIAKSRVTLLTVLSLGKRN